MPTVIDYDTVLTRLTGDGWHCLYPRSGAFGLPKNTLTTSLGWIGPPDPSLRPEAQSLARPVGEPLVDRLVSRFIDAWQALLPGELWLMPKSHWAYELQFGNATWLGAALETIGVEPKVLTDRTDGSAIEFDRPEVSAVTGFLTSLLMHLQGSDFLAAFPGRSTVCTVHSHRQLWWTTGDPAVAAKLDQMVPPR